MKCLKNGRFLDTFNFIISINTRLNSLAWYFSVFCLVFFAFTTILGWDYYGERCLEYLTGKDEKKIKIYRWLYILAVFIGPYMTVAAVWTIADIFNGLMALPNMIALFALSGVVVKETKRFFDVYADQKMANKKSSASIKDAAEN